MQLILVYIKSIYIFLYLRGFLLEKVFLSPLMVKLKIRVTPNDHRFALLCHCRAVGTMNREGWGVIALIYFDRRDVVRFSNPGGASSNVVGIICPLWL